jgi:hypothetical protein
MLHFQPKLIDAAKKYPNGSKNFFALYRMDIILDEDLKPHVIEVGHIQNLSEAPTLLTASRHLIFRRWTHQL